MGSVTAIHGLRVPVSTDLPDGPNQITALADDVDVILPIDSSTEPSAPENGTIWRNSTTGELSMYDGTAWISLLDDTGWISGTTGWTMLNDTVVSGALIRKVNKVVSLAVQFATGASTPISNLGNLTNLPLFQVPAAYVASSAPGTGEQGLSAGQSGPLASFTIDNTGTVRICAVDSAFFTLFGTPLASGTSFSVSGTYLAEA